MSLLKHDGWDRREFLKVLPVGAASLSLATQSARAAAFDGGLPLAYWGGPEADSAAGEEPGRVRDARHLPEGDRRFLASGARLTLHGLYPSEHLWAYTGWKGFEVDVVHDPVSDLRHLAWCCENRHAPNISSSISVRVPVRAEHGLCLAGAMRGKTTDRIPFALSLSTGEEKGTAKLRPGLYLAALRADGEVNWRGYRLDTDAQGNAGRQLYRRDAGPGLEALAPFPYLAFSVAYAV
jgi:hypothetical protein